MNLSLIENESGDDKSENFQSKFRDLIKSSKILFDDMFSSFLNVCKGSIKNLI